MPYKPKTNKRDYSRPQQDTRESSSQRGYDGLWQRFRAVYLRQHPICVHCTREGRTTLANEVHHIQALRDGGARLDPDNVEGLCKSCHSKETKKHG